MSENMSDSDVHYSHIPVPNTTAFRPTLVSIIVEYIVLVLTLAAFLYGVISWCLIKKFRHFRNFVYLEAIGSSLLRLTTVSIVIPGVMQVIVIDDEQIMDIWRYICAYFTTVQNYWLLVICYIFYVDIVKVFRGHVNRKYLKASLFAWGLPFITFLLYYIFIKFNKKILPSGSSSDLVANYVEVFIIISPLIFNCFIYIVVVFSLCRCFNPSGSTSTNNWRRFYIASLLFVLSDVIVLSSFIWDILSLSFFIRAVMSKLQQIVIDLFLPVVRSNRELWREYLKANKLDKSIP